MWPSILTINDLIDQKDLSEIRIGLDEARYLDGGVTAKGTNLAVKNNLELAPEVKYVETVKRLEKAIRENAELNYNIFPKRITRAIVSRYDQGMAYGEHIDSPVMGFMEQTRAMAPFGQNYVRSDFSMTIFLAEPDSYDGGELCFDSPWGVQTYKLPPGSAVTYPTGIPHSVSPVTRGTRLAAVLWLQSMIRDHEMRRLVADMSTLAQQLSLAGSCDDEADMARNLAATALRIVADV
jgi:PKHD-type hydroxylase